MARTEHVSFHNGHLDIDSLTLTRSLLQSEIKQIYICHMQDEIHHGDESFHILHLGDEFLLVGPFVGGGIGAIDALILNCPCIPVTRCLAGSIPYRFRQKGLLGIRFFPIPGLFFGPISDLKYFHLIVHGE